MSSHWMFGLYLAGLIAAVTAAVTMQGEYTGERVSGSRTPDPLHHMAKRIMWLRLRSKDIPLLRALDPGNPSVKEMASRFFLIYGRRKRSSHPEAAVVGPYFSSSRVSPAGGAVSRPSVSPSRASPATVQSLLRHSLNDEGDRSLSAVLLGGAAPWERISLAQTSGKAHVHPFKPFSDDDVYTGSFNEPGGALLSPISPRSDPAGADGYFRPSGGNSQAVRPVEGGTLWGGDAEEDSRVGRFPLGVPYHAEVADHMRRGRLHPEPEGGTLLKAVHLFGGSAPRLEEVYATPVKARPARSSRHGDPLFSSLDEDNRFTTT